MRYMHDPLHRLYRAKLVLLATILIVGGLVLLVLGHWVTQQPQWRWLSNWPLVDIGSGLFTTGLLGVAWQYVDGNDGEVRDTERLKRVLADSAPDMRDAVIRGFAFEPADLARVATPETLDQIITNGLAIRLGDADFARDIYHDLQAQAINRPERLFDAHVAIHLSPLPRGTGTAKSRAELFAVTTRWEYSLVPIYPTRRIICTADSREFRELSDDNAGTSAWYFKPKGRMQAADPDAFEVLDFTVDGEPRKLRRSAKADSQTYSASIGAEAVRAGKRITVAYTLRTVTAVNGHRLRLRVDQPTKGLAIDIDYSDTDLSEIAVLDYIASGERTRIRRTPPSVPDKVVTVEFDGWVFPRSGVAFVWT